jgi:hypothetical protein
MATLPFPCSAVPLSTFGFQSAVNALGVDAATIWALLTVETPGCGYLRDMRPQILFERHIFHRLTGGAFDGVNANISNPLAGGYGPGGAAQYPRLGAAVALNQDAALQSASWGLGQVMGEHFSSLGFASVADLVAGMCATEDRQLAAVVAFIMGNGLDTALQSQDWATYAHGYNGPNYAQNAYDTKLAHNYALFSGGVGTPDLTIRAAQIYLNFLGFGPLAVDGQLGPGTLTALHNFQSSNGQTLTPGIDGNVTSALLAALPPANNLGFV